MSDMLDNLDLVLRPDRGSDVDVLSILDWIKLPDGWSQAPSNDETPADETLTLNIDAASHDDLAAILQDLDEKIKQVKWAQHPLEPNGVWLRTKLKDETNARQAYITRARRGTARVTQPAMSSAGLYQYIFGLTRTPAWESPDLVNEDIAAIDCLGGMVEMSAAVGGDLPARVALASVYPISSATFNQFWMGFRGDRFGVAANFEPVWSCFLAQGQTWGADTDDETDADAIGGFRMAVTFATVPTLAQRLILSAGDITVTNYADQVGQYQVLLRAKMTDTSTALVRIGYGFVDRNGLVIAINNPQYNTLQLVSGTSYKLYEMGVVSIPTEMIIGSTLLTNCAIQIDAQRLTGSGSLYLDSLILIPISEGFIKGSVEWDMVEARSARIYRHPGNRLYGVANTGGYGIADTNTIDVLAAEESNWSVPTTSDPPYLIFAAGGLTAAPLGDEAAVQLDYYPRWATLRGAA